MKLKYSEWVCWESSAAFILLECLCPCMSPNHTVITSFGKNALGKIANKKPKMIQPQVNSAVSQVVRPNHWSRIEGLGLEEYDWGFSAVYWAGPQTLHVGNESLYQSPGNQLSPLHCSWFLWVSLHSSRDPGLRLWDIRGSFLSPPYPKVTKSYQFFSQCLHNPSYSFMAIATSSAHFLDSHHWTRSLSPFRLISFYLILPQMVGSIILHPVSLCHSAEHYP